MRDDSEHLELRKEIGGLRNYLAGKPVHAADLLELQLDDGKWILGRYEWNWRLNETPSFYLQSEGPIIDITSQHRLRWPEKF